MKRRRATISFRRAKLFHGHAAHESTLDDCNEVLDWLDETFDFGKEMRARVREAGNDYYVLLTWYGAEHPSTLGFYTPIGWTISGWWLDEDRNWNTGIYRIKKS